MVNLSFIRFISGLNRYIYRFYFLNEKSLRRIQDSSFRQVLKYAYSNIPFYRDTLLDNNIKLDNIKNLNQIIELPFTEPHDLFSMPLSIRSYAKGPSPMKFRSSGTSGYPKDIFLSAYDYLYTMRCAYLRMIFSSGCSPFYKTVFLRTRNSIRNIKAKWHWKLGMLREYYICTDESKHKQIALINRYRPDIINCLVADGVRLAYFIKGNNGIFHKARYVFTTGEILTNKEREILRDNLGKKVIDFYASRETGIIAWECVKGGGYHINADQIYVEIIDGNKQCEDGEVGEVVVTTLTPCYSPLIRYRTGDMAILKRGRCKCGSSFPRLLRIEGRKNDFLRDVKGREISPYLLMVTMDSIKEVEKYRIHQEGEKKYTIYLMLNSALSNRAIIEEKVKKAYERIFGRESLISIKDLSSFPKVYKGIKRKVIFSNL